MILLHPNRYMRMRYKTIKVIKKIDTVDIEKKNNKARHKIRIVNTARWP